LQLLTSLTVVGVELHPVVQKVDAYWHGLIRIADGAQDTVSLKGNGHDILLPFSWRESVLKVWEPLYYSAALC
jgi:hypothetical protein